MSVYVIGDIHGEVGALTQLMEKVNPGPRDVVIQLGDCVDRGPDSFEVVQFWIRLRSCQKCVIGGNHEELFFEYLSEGSNQFTDYGGQATIESYQANGWRCERGNTASIPRDHLDFILQTHPWTRPLLATPEFIFTHAGYNFALDKNHQNPHDLRWGRVEGWSEGKPTVVRGHTPQKRVQRGKGIIQIDTGCGSGGKLSCLCLQTGEVFTAWP